MAITVVQKSGIMNDDCVEIPGWDDLEKKASSNSLENLRKALHHVEGKLNEQLDERVCKSEFDGLKKWLDKEGSNLWGAVKGKIDDTLFNQRLDEIKHTLDNDALRSRLCGLIEEQLHRIDDKFREHLKSITDAVGKYLELRNELECVYDKYQTHTEAAVTLIVQQIEIAKRIREQVEQDLATTASMLDETRKVSASIILCKDQTTQNLEQAKAILDKAKEYDIGFRSALDDAMREIQISVEQNENQSAQALESVKAAVVEAREYGHLVRSEIGDARQELATVSKQCKELESRFSEVSQYMATMKSKTVMQRFKWLFTGK